MTLKRTQLYEWHVKHGGRMVPFAGWEMPIQYSTGPIEEHHITRRSAGLFDIDHMGQIEISGSDATVYLNKLVTWDIRRMADYEAHYALMCDDYGGIIDDLFIYKLPDRWLVVVNADNRAKDYSWMQSNAAGYGVSIEDISDQTYMLALQGPKAIELLQTVTEISLAEVPRFTAVEGTLKGIPCLIGRTGYTGEDGVELFFAEAQAVTIWEMLLQAGPTANIEVAPIGLAARDSLRFEPGFALYGHEITQEATPLEANLGWVCDFNLNFIGRNALMTQKEQGLKKKLIAFEMIDKGVPRQDYSVKKKGGQKIGEVVTGLYAPTVEKYCGHAFIPPKYAKVGTELQVVIRGKPKAAVVVKPPFYIPAYRKPSSKPKQSKSKTKESNDETG